MSDINEAQAKEYEFNTINIKRVSNGFVLELDKLEFRALCSDSIYVFNTIEKLSDFIKELK